MLAKPLVFEDIVSNMMAGAACPISATFIQFLLKAGGSDEKGFSEPCESQSDTVPGGVLKSVTDHLARI